MKHIVFSPEDFTSMTDLMDKYGNTQSMLSAKNENGEYVHLSIFKNFIVATTLQFNGWVRENIYWRDKTVEEIFIGKWE